MPRLLVCYGVLSLWSPGKVDPPFSNPVGQTRCRTSLTQPSPQGAGYHVPGVFGMIQHWIVQTIIRETERVTGEILSPGERTEVRADFKINLIAQWVTAWARPAVWRRLSPRSAVAGRCCGRCLSGPPPHRSGSNAHSRPARFSTGDPSRWDIGCRRT